MKNITDNQKVLSTLIAIVVSMLAMLMFWSFADFISMEFSINETTAKFIGMTIGNFFGLFEYCDIKWALMDAFQED